MARVLNNSGVVFLHPKSLDYVKHLSIKVFLLQREQVHDLL